MATWNIAAGTSAASLQTIITNNVQNDPEALIRLVFAAGTHDWNPSSSLSLSIPGTCTEFHWEGEGWNDTIIVDNWANGSSALCFIGGINAKFRMHDFQFTTGANYVGRNIHFALNGVTDNFRVYSMKSPYTTWMGKFFSLTGYIRGVIDHCQIELLAGGVMCAVGYDYPDSYGDTRWAEATPKGGSAGELNNLFIEDCSYVTYYATNAVLNDTDHGGCMVIRFCTVGSTGCETHSTSSNRSRGGRHLEFYCNHCTLTAAGSGGQGPLGYLVGFINSGTFYGWNNELDPTNGYLKAFQFLSNQRGNGTYGQGTTPLFWGYGGTTGHFQYALVNTSGTTVTISSSTNNFGGGAGQYGYGVSVGGRLNINGTEYTIATMNSNTQVTLTGSAGTQSGVPCWPVDNWHGNTDVYGYPLMDQMGRGQGDLLVDNFPNCYNSDRGANPAASGHTTTLANPRQQYEPVYIWQTPWTAPSGWTTSYLRNDHPEVIVENRDFFMDYVGTGVTGGGVIVGTEATMLADTGNFVGQAYWVTDLGDWNDGSNAQYTGQGQLWVWNGSNWVFDYEPAPYPHPLIVADAGAPIPAGRKTRTGKISRSF